MMLPSMIWSIFLLASTGMLYFDSTDANFAASVEQLPGLALNPGMAEWIAANKLPESFDDPESSLASSSFRGSDSYKIRLPSAQAVCNQFVQSQVSTLGNRRLGVVPEITECVGSCLANGLNLLFHCLLGGPNPSPDKEGVVSTRLSPAERLQRRLSRGIRDLRLRDIQAFPVGQLRHAMTVSHKSYRTEYELFVDDSIDDLRMDQVEGFPIYIPGEEEFDTQAYVWLSRTNRTLTIAFRGTQTVTDMIHDLDYVITPLGQEYPNVLVHRGFKGKVSSILFDIVEIVNDHKSLYDTILYTGHSLGGALATLTAPIIASQQADKRHECLTFGSPRVGNEEFVQWFRSVLHLHMRVTTETDPIAILPFEEVYQHVSQSVSISDDLGFSYVPEIPQGKRFLYAIEDFISVERMMEDHRLTTYINRMTSALTAASVNN